MTRWNLSIREETDRKVRADLGRTGLEQGDLSRFVEDAVRAEALRRTVLEVDAHNADLSAEDAMALANEAAAFARVHPA